MHCATKTIRLDSDTLSLLFVVSSKIQQYSPMDFKAYEKSVNRKHGLKFQPTQVLELLARAEPLCQRNAEHRREIVNAYLNVRNYDDIDDDNDADDGSDGDSNNYDNNDDDDVILSSSKN